MAQKIRKVGIYHHPESVEAREFAQEILERLEPQLDATWIASAWDPVASTKDLPETDLLITIGGDGTVLRAARAVVPHPILILGVDMGRLAFLTELVPDELRERLDDILAGDYTVDQRTMLAVEFEGFGGNPPEVVHALNDVTVGRTSLGRPRLRQRARQRRPDWECCAATASSWPAPPDRPAIPSRRAVRFWIPRHSSSS